ncbi:predicted protein, partial [Nematostella vectensis]
EERAARRKATYAYLKEHFKVTQFIMESGAKLSLPQNAMSSACVLYHQFWKGCDPKDFDPYLIGMTAIYLASKAEECPCKVRDVINVCYRSSHKDSPCLEINARYWELRESVVNCELLMLRVLGFRVSYDNPHKYLLHYLKVLQDWTCPGMWERSQVPQISWSYLLDSHHIPLCLEYPPAHVAVALLHFAVECVGLEVPSQEAVRPWWKALCSDVTPELIQSITEDVMDMYDFENKPV